MATPILTPVEILRRLVAFDTVSSRPNRPLIDWVADYLRAHAVEPEILPGGDGKANLYATVGPAEVGGIVLSGHTDVVPVADQDWRSDPFTLDERDSRLYGRGTADMKAFLALSLCLLVGLRDRQLSTPVHLALSYDEEVGGLGAPGLIAHIVRQKPLPRLVIVGEPTSMRPVNTHKGLRYFRTTVTGKDAHSSMPQLGASAIVYAAEIIGFIAGLAADARARPAPASSLDPPYSTFNVGQIEGGTALNIIPRSCSFTWDHRSLPEEDPEATVAAYEGFVASRILPRIRADHPAAAVETTRVAALPGLRPDPDGPAETLALRLTGEARCGMVPFGTEAGLFQQAGIPAVVCGPGDIAQAHQPNEFITLDQLRAGEAFLRKVADLVTA